MSELDLTIVMPTHNRPALLGEALESLRNQTRGGFEVIVVDDYSTPEVDRQGLGSVQGNPVRLIRNGSSVGGAASKSAGALQAGGRFIGFLDDDDLLRADYVATLVDAFDAHPEVDVLFLDVEWFGEGSEGSDRSHREATQAVVAATTHHRTADGCVVFDAGLPAALIRSTPMQFQRPVLRRHVLETVGGFRPECLLWDCDWAIRAALQVRCAYLPRPLYRQREQGQGYFSRPGRVVAMAASIYEITDRLYRNPPEPLNAAMRRLLRELTALKAFDLAYLESQQGAIADALGHWWTSQRLSPNLQRLKFPLGVLRRAFAARRSAAAPENTER